MGKMKDVREAAKTYAQEARRDWRETHSSTKDIRKLEGTHPKKKK